MFAFYTIPLHQEIIINQELIRPRNSHVALGALATHNR